MISTVEEHIRTKERRADKTPVALDLAQEKSDFCQDSGGKTNFTPNPGSQHYCLVAGKPLSAVSSSAFSKPVVSFLHPWG